ncbi:septal ring lytic transglycosylase RlpA family protein [Catellatospora sp. KI3]|uniref:septal ring lytic transglycosylase RlpA family protein n=1 Tax=Catellatospora sp. KI3 TaxID=3041620 RepID=UPI0024827F3E|nr:septal ring lytic transglycosylase RlpA family protein [Catellatospora sp. KI3]MDI1462801.1 septal ring lytic transglycosylase RlpA family protein [Catellatospora sp. KI3]
MSGRHSLEHKPRRTFAPIATATVATAILVGGTALAVEATSTDTGTDTGTTQHADSLAAASPSVTPIVVNRIPDKVSRGAVRAATATDGPRTTVVGSGTCKASFYAEGQGTANGERFNPDELTAAHKTLKFNTRVRVTNPANGKSVVVRINDRGPYIAGRCLDLSRAAFAEIAKLSSGVTTVRYDILK